MIELFQGFYFSISLLKKRKNAVIFTFEANFKFNQKNLS